MAFEITSISGEHFGPYVFTIGSHTFELSQQNYGERDWVLLVGDDNPNEGPRVIGTRNLKWQRALIRGLETALEIVDHDAR